MAPASTPDLRSGDGQPVGAVLGAHEDQRATRAGGDLGGDVGLGVVLHGPHPVVHGRDAAGRGRDGVDRRVLEVLADQLVDAAVERRGEQQALRGGVGLVEQLLHGRQEAEVGHVVGLVEDGDLDLGERALALLDQVLEAARRRDDEVDAAAQLVDLAAHRRAAVDRHDLEVERLGERREGVLHLLGQLAGRHEDEPAGRAAAALAADEAGEQRQAEGERLARAGGAAAEDVAAGERVGDGAGLDGERRVQLAARQRGDEPLRQAERGEGRRGRVGLSAAVSAASAAASSASSRSEATGRTGRAGGAAAARTAAVAGRAAGGGTGGGGTARHEEADSGVCQGAAEHARGDSPDERAEHDTRSDRRAARPRR